MIPSRYCALWNPSDWRRSGLTLQMKVEQQGTGVVDSTKDLDWREMAWVESYCGEEASTFFVGLDVVVGHGGYEDGDWVVEYVECDVVMMIDVVAVDGDDDDFVLIVVCA